MEVPYPEPAHSVFYYEVLGKMFTSTVFAGVFLFPRELLETPCPPPTRSCVTCTRRSAPGYWLTWKERIL